MLLKLRQLVVENLGYKRNITSKIVYINSNNIISITDYAGASDFLMSEGSQFSSDSFSLIRVSNGNNTEDVITFGDADSIYSMAKGEQCQRRLLND